MPLKHLHAVRRHSSRCQRPVNRRKKNARRMTPLPPRRLFLAWYEHPAPIWNPLTEALSDPIRKRIGPRVRQGLPSYLKVSLLDRSGTKCETILRRSVLTLRAQYRISFLEIGLKNLHHSIPEPLKNRQASLTMPFDGENAGYLPAALISQEILRSLTWPKH